MFFTDHIYIVIVGHDLQTKTKVANALIRQENGFRQFRCRRNLLVKSVVGTTATTVAGKTLNIALTPNLNTPAWTHMKPGISLRYKNKVFVYVQSPGHVNVNDDKSVETIRNTFGVTTVYMLTYFQDPKDVASANPDNVYIHERMSFKERILQVEKILSAIGKTSKSEVKYVNQGQDEIGSTSANAKKPVKLKTSSRNKSNEKEIEERKEFLGLLIHI